ncbi:MAG: hypothetical protein V4664_00575 [Patescibacteria group bacterium]
MAEQPKKNPATVQAASGKGRLRAIFVALLILVVLCFTIGGVWQHFSGTSKGSNNPKTTASKGGGLISIDSFIKIAPPSPPPKRKSEERKLVLTKSWSEPVEIKVGKSMDTTFEGKVGVRVNGNRLIEHVKGPDGEKYYPLDNNGNRRKKVNTKGEMVDETVESYGNQVHQVEFVTGDVEGKVIAITLFDT